MKPVFQASCLIVVALAAMSTACSSPTTPSSTPSTSSTSSASTSGTQTNTPSTPPSGTLTAVTVSGTAPAAGALSQFTATAALADTSSRPVTSEAAWQSSNTAVATVNAGMVTGVAPGEADISATYQNVTGKVHVTITPPAAPTVRTLSVTGPVPAIGVTSQFTALAFYTDNTSKEVTNVAIWRSSNTAVATVNNGQVKGIAAGETDVVAEYQGVSAQVHLTIASSGTPPSGPTATLVSLSGVAPSLGNSSSFTATATLSDGSLRNVTNLATWQSSNASVANVINGVVIGVAAGQADISATYQNITGTTHVVIAAAPCVFAVFPTALSIASTGGTATLTVSTGPTCRWTATSSDTFVTITSGAAGSGSGVVSISVAADAGAARSATLTIGDVRVPVTQAGGQSAPNCGAALLPAGADYSAEMKEGSVTVTIAPGCQWTASTTSTFITLNTFAASGTGNGSFTYRVFGNLTGVPRSGSIKVGQQTFNITQRAALGGNSLSFVSDPGDYIGQGWTLLHEAPTSSFSPTFDSARNHLSFRIVSSDGLDTLDWSLDFAAPKGQQLTTGTYVNATRYPFQAPTVPGLSFGGDGRGCNQLSGQFTIADFAYGADGTVQRLTATFEQHCEGGGPALRGKIVYAR